MRDSLLVRWMVCVAALAVVLGFGRAWAAASPESGPLVCFSLNGAQAHLGEPGDFTSEIAHLGHITDVEAFAVDAETGDLIVIGRRNPALPDILTDDLIVALRLEPDGEPPGVSLNIIPSERGKLSLLAQYFGGVRYTHFGQVCFDADYLLKKMDAGLVGTGSPRVPSPRLLSMVDAREEDLSETYGNHMCFIPSDTRILLSHDAVVLDECRIVVHNVDDEMEVAAEADLDDESPGAVFSRTLSDHYDEVAEVYPVLHELRTLMVLVTLARGLHSLDVQPDISFWLETYDVARVETPRFLPMEEWGELGVVYSRLQRGGVYMRAAAERIKTGDPYVYAEAARLTRPSADAVSWVIPIEDGSLAPAQSIRDAMVQDRLSLASFKLARRRCDEAHALFAHVLELDPLCAEGVVGVREALECPSLAEEETASESPGVGDYAAQVPQLSLGESAVPSLAEETFPPDERWEASSNYVEAKVRLDFSYGTVKPSPFPTAALYVDHGLFAVRVPLSVSWANRNLLRVDASLPVAVHIEPWHVPTGAGATHTVVGLAGGLQDPTLGARYLAWSSADARSSVLSEARLLAPTKDPFFETYINKEEDDSQVLSWDSPFWKAYGGIQFATHLSSRTSATLSGSWTHRFGDEPVRGVGITEGTKTGYHVEPLSSWGVGLDVNLYLPSTTSYISGIGLTFQHSQLRDRLDVVEESDYIPSRITESRGTTIIALTISSGDQKGTSYFRLGTATSRATIEGSSTAFFIQLGLGHNWSFVERWF